MEQHAAEFEAEIKDACEALGLDFNDYNVKAAIAKFSKAALRLAAQSGLYNEDHELDVSASYMLITDTLGF